MEEENKTISLSPKGLILLSLGGYMDKNQGSTAEQQTESVIEGLVNYMQKNSCALMVVDGKLTFVAVREGKRKKFLGIF